MRNLTITQKLTFFCFLFSPINIWGQQICTPNEIKTTITINASATIDGAAFLNLKYDCSFNPVIKFYFSTKIDAATVSPDVFLSLARPLAGWPKSQKYLKVCSCTLVSNASSVIKGNLSEESILLTKFMVSAESNLPPACDFSVVFTEREYFVKACKERLGIILNLLN